MVRSARMTYTVIPAKAGIQGTSMPSVALDARLRGGDGRRSEWG
jgi:hypothetical protein